MALGLSLVTDLVESTRFLLLTCGADYFVGTLWSLDLVYCIIIIIGRFEVIF